MAKEHFKDWEHVYRATDGKKEYMVEAHEWMCPDWDEEAAPFGSIYYDMYELRDDGVWQVYDGGVVGYDEGAFTSMDEFKKYLNEFMVVCGQGLTLLDPLCEEDEEKFWEMIA